MAMGPRSYLRSDLASSRRERASSGAARLALLALLGLAACQRTVNMAAVQKSSWNATTIPYVGVREENRQYPDYGPINASIMTSATPAAQKPPPGKRGAPR